MHVEKEKIQNSQCFIVSFVHVTRFAPLYKFVSNAHPTSRIVYTVGSEMVVRLLALITGNYLLPRNIIFLFLVVISVRG
jgi:hypothetical protein